MHEQSSRTLFVTALLGIFTIYPFTALPRVLLFVKIAYHMPIPGVLLVMIVLSKINGQRDKTQLS